LEQSSAGGGGSGGGKGGGAGGGEGGGEGGGGEGGGEGGGGEGGGEGDSDAAAPCSNWKSIHTARQSRMLTLGKLQARICTARERCLPGGRSPPIVKGTL